MTATATPISSYEDLVNLLTQDGVAFNAEPQVQTVRVQTQMRGIDEIGRASCRERVSSPV